MIKLENLSKTYVLRGGNEVRALSDVNLTVNTGEIHGIVGQSGAGKSTLIRCLTGLEQPTDGSVYLDGTDLSGLGHSALRKARRKIGMVFQAANLMDSRTALENIAYPLKIAGVPKKERLERATELLKVVGLENRAGSYPSQLSGGQQQRVGIARALATKPAVLLCDEPTSALDSETTRQILALLQQIRDEVGVTIVIITHEMGVVRDICDSATMLEHGQILESGTVRQIVANPKSKLARELVPMPSVDETITDANSTILDVMFTSTPGVPTGATVLAMASRMGGDVAAGTFETLSNVQVGRLALTVPTMHLKQIMETLEQNDVAAEVRS
ncbi:methionine ABC transporter ATP-binding protein [uncultured Actinomyces sp.]|uniref:methionine ABC transporter ATP-binding protein n=1 Tax=uncultured Actinomyces sp. TaxID=249061 RepID=UPI00262D83E6|nr:methionine ABC transporter ATP-binding protein [uncultured Actinomyces sp.]